MADLGSVCWNLSTLEGALVELDSTLTRVADALERLAPPKEDPS
jgi:hypothetical protein